VGQVVAWFLLLKVCATVKYYQSETRNDTQFPRRVGYLVCNPKQLPVNLLDSRFRGNDDAASTTRYYLGPRILSCTPNLRKIVIMGHQFVKADCAKLSPTNPVNNSQYGL
jgi:hypothetical protein